jgi:hypothetical protein
LDQGGTLVAIHATQFGQASNYECSFGDKKVDAIYVNETTILCQSPSSDVQGIFVHYDNL